MEYSTTSTSNFRFRDHHRDMDDDDDSSITSDLSSVGIGHGLNDDDDDDETTGLLQSMTAKGIKHLCSELLEIKSASDEDFRINVFANYQAFHKIFEEVVGMENEIQTLKTQISSQKNMVTDLDNIYLNVLPDEATELASEDSDYDTEQSPANESDAHINDISEYLDILIAENRIDEAIAMLELESENFKNFQSDHNFSTDILMSYSSSISERKTMLIIKLTNVAENRRTPAAELQKALVGLFRLGETSLASQLLLKYYHSRIETGIYDINHSTLFLNGSYIKELSKFVFSMLSQAATSFEMLYKETSPEFIQWVREEIELFVAAFNRYIKSISETSNGLSTSVEAVQCALSFCSLLENQKLVLRPCLIKYIRPSMEEVLKIQIDRYKKVISIFTETESWILGRYRVPGVFIEGNHSMAVVQQQQYCLLTNSGRKFASLLQAIKKDVTPLVALQMEGCILKGLVSLFAEYIVILERGVSYETNVSEKSDSKEIFNDVLLHQVSILANVSTLEYLFSGIVWSFGAGKRGNSGLTTDHSFRNQQKEPDSCTLFIQKAASRLRGHFFQQFISRIMSVLPENCPPNRSDPSVFCVLMPSPAFQVLFLELRKLDKLSEDTPFDVDWLMELLRQLIEAVFGWITKNKDIWETTEENWTVKHSDAFNQFILDVNFLVEIANHGKFFSDDPAILTYLFRSAIVSAGLTLNIDDEVWAKEAATKTIQLLLETERSKSQLDNKSSTADFLVDSPETQSDKGDSDSVQDDSRISTEEVLGENFSPAVNSVVTSCEVENREPNELP
ncbi:hypothetical protein ACFE04_014528 [Oxalis oulophora]